MVAWLVGGGGRRVDAAPTTATTRASTRCSVAACQQMVVMVRVMPGACWTVVLVSVGVSVVWLLLLLRRL